MTLTRYRAGAVLVAVLSIAACGGADESLTQSTGQPTSQATGAEEPDDVTLMLNWTPNAHHVGVFAALSQGWYEQAGIDLTVIEPADAGVEQAVAVGVAALVNRRHIAGRPGNLHPVEAQRASVANADAEIGIRAGAQRLSLRQRLANFDAGVIGDHPAKQAGCVRLILLGDEFVDGAAI